MKRQPAFFGAAILSVCCFATGLSAATVNLLPPFQTSPQAVGTALQWTAGFTDVPEPAEYSWSVTTPDGLTSVVQDFDPARIFTYMPLQDGTYTVTVAAKTAGVAMTPVTASLPTAQQLWSLEQHR